MKIGAQEKRGCSRRIGSVQKDSAVRAVAARCRGTRRFATLHSACPYAMLPFQEPRETGTGEAPVCEGLLSCGRGDQDASSWPGRDISSFQWL